MDTFPLRSIVVVGAGVSGWLAANTLRRVLGAACAVRVVKLPDDNAINGALAAVPSLHRLFDLIGIDELTLMRATRATYRLGTEFRGWGAPEQRYFQGFGSIGAKLDAVPFQHHWLRLARTGDCEALEAYSMAAQLARLGRFAPPQDDPRSVLSLYSYAWHFDARLLAAAFRDQALQAGVTELHGALADLERGTQGQVRALMLADGTRHAADFFIDCSGARAALASRLEVPFDDWSDWLPCDRLQALHSPSTAAPAPFSVAEAQPCGWAFSLPLQHGTVLGEVYDSEFIGDAEISAGLAARAGRVTHPPRVAHLLRGRPREFWVGNCLLMPGEALDPLESTGLHLAQTGITRLLAHFPVRNDSPTDRAEYNRLTAEEYDRIRDILALHYHASTRSDSPFWVRRRAAQLPATLAQRLELFTDSARLNIGEEEHCGVDGWLAVLLGQGVQPQAYDPLADATPGAHARDALARLAAEMRACAAAAPGHQAFLARLGAGAAPPAPGNS